MKFCTYFDHFYIDRGLVLIESLRRFQPDAEVHVLALSQQCEAFIESLSLENVVVASLEDTIRENPALASVQSSRTRAEFAFTLTPFLVLLTLQKARDGEQVVYLDADMMFFSSPEDLIRRSSEYDVQITPHRFSKHLQHKSVFGLYNVGWVGFRKTEQGQKCADWWAEKCLDWCFDRLEGEKYADQKYLETFSLVAQNLLVLEDLGINCAPWNVSGHSFTKRRGHVFIDGEPLILYHFSKAKRINAWCIAPRTMQQVVRSCRGLHSCVYTPYARALDDVSRRYKIPQDFLFDSGDQRPSSDTPSFNRDQSPSLDQLLRRILWGEYTCKWFAIPPWTERCTLPS